MKTKSGLLRLAAVPALAAGFALAFAGAASASATQKPSAAATQVGSNQAPAGAILVPMTFVPPKTAHGVAPANTVYGNCGSSWFALGNLGAGQARASYGFDIDEPAIAYAAYATVAGTSIIKDNTQTGTLADRDSWDGGFTATIGDGYAFGYVELIAYLADNKGTCVSDGPSGSAIVT